MTNGDNDDDVSSTTWRSRQQILLELPRIQTSIIKKIKFIYSLLMCYREYNYFIVVIITHSGSSSLFIIPLYYICLFSLFIFYQLINFRLFFFFNNDINNVVCGGVCVMLSWGGSRHHFSPTWVEGYPSSTIFLLESIAPVPMTIFKMF